MSPRPSGSLDESSGRMLQCGLCNGAGVVLHKVKTCAWCKGSGKDRGLLARLKGRECPCCHGQGRFWAVVQ